MVIFVISLHPRLLSLVPTRAKNQLNLAGVFTHFANFTNSNIQAELSGKFRIQTRTGLEFLTKNEFELVFTLVGTISFKANLTLKTV